jgi:hypothetical protein
MRKNQIKLLRTILYLCWAILFVESKIDRNAPHHHRGILTPYTPGPFAMELDNVDEDTLRKGNPVMKQMEATEEQDSQDKQQQQGGKAICVQDVNAPKKAVWNQILDLDTYTSKVNKLKECKNYFIKSNDDGSVTIKTKMVIGVMPGYSYENYYNHNYRPDCDSVTWSLDYDKTNDFDDVAGHWHVEDHPSKPGCSRVFYACDIKFKNALPGPIVNFLQKTALKQATAWVKKESELHSDADIPKAFLPANDPGFAQLE